MVKILLVSALATFVGLATLWALNINIGAWVGMWVAPEDAQSAGLSILAFLGLAAGLAYHASLGTKFGGPGAVRGLIAGVILAVVMIWVAPLLVKVMGIATGDTRTVFQGPGDSNSYAANQGNVKVKDPGVGDAPTIFDIKPPLAEVTAGKKWTHPDDWQGRLLPFLVGFCMYGLVLGLFLSEDPHK
jgi:hypothetical protein